MGARYPRPSPDVTNGRLVMSHLKAASVVSVLALACALAGCSAPVATTASRPTPTSTLPFAFGAPVNLGPAINTLGFEGGPSLSADGLTLYYISERDGGSGGG